MKKIMIIAIIFIILLVGVGIYFLFFSNTTRNIAEDPVPTYMRPPTLTPDDYGWYEIYVPSTLLGGDAPYQFISNMFHGNSPFAVLYDGLHYYIAPDGSLTLYFYDEWLDFARHGFYTMIFMFCSTFYPPSFPHSPIKSITYEDNLLTEITVLVEEENFYNTATFPIVTFTNLSFSLWAGHFQLLSGVPADEWGVTITVLCYDTGDLISQESFPQEDMFDREW